MKRIWLIFGLLLFSWSYCPADGAQAARSSGIDQYVGDYRPQDGSFVWIGRLSPDGGQERLAFLDYESGRVGSFTSELLTRGLIGRSGKKTSRRKKVTVNLGALASQRV